MCIDIIIRIFCCILFIIIISHSFNYSKYTLKETTPQKHLNIEDYINNYLSKIPNKFYKSKKEERNFLTKFLNFKDLPTDPNQIYEIKMQLLEKFSKEYKKNLTHIDTVFLTSKWYFGNSFVSMNNLLFYCEILGCKQIILNSNYTLFKWLLKNKIIYNKGNTTIIINQALVNSINCSSPNIVCSFLGGFLYYPMVVKPQVRVEAFKNEVLNNLPKIITHPNDLSIHIRSGDIFTIPKVTVFYAQPPLCFYEKILQNYKFNKIYIIAQDNSNIVIDKLLNIYKNIEFKRHSIKFDISHLIYAYNLVASVSSFFISIIKFNDNVKNMWEYDIYRMSEKYKHLHHDFFKFPIKYNIYTMKPTNYYKKEMFHWSKSVKQLRLMLREKCPYNFVIRTPDTN